MTVAIARVVRGNTRHQPSGAGTCVGSAGDLQAVLGSARDGEVARRAVAYYAKELSEGLKKMPADMRANYLKMNARTLTDLKVTKQTITADVRC
jgi:hypothetical protein